MVRFLGFQMRSFSVFRLSDDLHFCAFESAVAAIAAAAVVVN
jgi:hypothetical protein